MTGNRASRLGRLVQERRLAAGLTQEQLAESVRTTRSHIASIESGKTKVPPPPLVNALARALPVTVAELLIAMGYGVESNEELRQRAVSGEMRIISEIRRIMQPGERD